MANASVCNVCVLCDQRSCQRQLMQKTKKETDRTKHEQELSYRKQIARQLRTQYVDCIYKPDYPVTLKSRLRVTQGE